MIADFTISIHLLFKNCNFCISVFTNITYFLECSRDYFSPTTRNNLCKHLALVNQKPHTLFNINNIYCNNKNAVQQSKNFLTSMWFNVLQLDKSRT